MTSTYDFIKFKSKTMLNMYSKAVRETMRTPHPYYQKSERTKDGQKQTRLLFTIKHGRSPTMNHTHNLFDILEDCELLKFSQFQSKQREMHWWNILTRNHTFRRENMKQHVTKNC